MPKLKIVSKEAMEIRPLEDSLLIGSETDNDIRVSGERVAKRHCKICRDGKLYKVVDASGYGTHVNGVPVQECLLRHGDTIVVGGEMVITFIEEQHSAMTTQQRRRVVDLDNMDRMVMTALLKVNEPIELGKAGLADFAALRLEDFRIWLGAMGGALFLYERSGHRLASYSGIDEIFTPVRSLLFDLLVPKLKDISSVKEISDLAAYGINLNRTPCEHICKLLAVPLMPIKTEIIARFAIEKPSDGLLLFLYDNRKKKFSHGDFTFVESLAHQLVTTIRDCELFVRASTDPVTHLYNRGFFEQTLKRQMDVAAERREFLSVVLLDLEYRRGLQEEYGIEGSEEVMSEVAQLILKHVTMDDMAARYGGGKFVVLLPRQSSIRAHNWATTIHTAFEKYGFTRSNVALSIGTATFPDNAMSAEEIMKRADQAVYRAKKKGGNQAVYYDEAKDATAPRTDALAGVISGNAAKDYGNIQMLVETINVMAAHSDFESLMDKLIEKVLQITHAERAVIFLGDTAQELKAQFGRDRVGNRLNTIERYSNTIPQKVMETGQPQCVLGETGEQEVASSMSMTQFALRTVMCAPLRNQEQNTFGVLYVDSRMRGKKYEMADLIFFETIAKQIALAIENSRLQQLAQEQERMRHELTLASQIQQRFLPQTQPALANFGLYGHMWPALEVGGDYYDIVETIRKKVYVCIGDVSGKGMGAGLIMVMARTTLHSLLSNNPSLACSDLLLHMNSVIHHNTRRGIFMSMLLMQIDLVSSKINYSGAGHEHLLIWREKEKKCEKIPAGGLILGVKPNQDYVMQELLFHVGDKLLLYTDGATEAMDSEQKEFGLDALSHLVEDFHHLPCREMCEAVYGALLKFMAGEKQHDDITLVALERKK
jgi:diguanylate cyclase (GGDEF)-like protein